MLIGLPHSDLRLRSAHVSRADVRREGPGIRYTLPSISSHQKSNEN